MAAGSRVHLNSSGAGRADAFGVEQCLLIAFNDADVMTRAELTDRRFEQGRLTGARRAGDIERKNIPLSQPCAVLFGDEVVLRQNLLLQGDGFGVVVVVVVIVIVIVVVIVIVIVRVAVFARERDHG